MKVPQVSLQAQAALLLVGWGLVWIGHTQLSPAQFPPWFVGVADPAVHGLVSVLLVLPLFLRRVVDAPVAIIAVLLGVLIDLDHALAAGTFNFKAMLSLPGRPVGHSLLVATLVAAAVALLLRGWRHYHGWGLFYLFLASLLSHIARDGVTPWAFPWSAPPIPGWVFFGLFVPLSFLHLAYAGRYAGRNHPASVNS